MEAGDCLVGRGDRGGWLFETNTGDEKKAD